MRLPARQTNLLFGVRLIHQETRRDEKGAPPSCAHASLSLGGQESGSLEYTSLPASCSS